MHRRCQNLRLCSLGDRGIGMENCWKITDWGRPNYSEGNLSQCHAVQHKSHMAGIDPENRDETI
jgi:hypothetical protein